MGLVVVKNLPQVEELLRQAVVRVETVTLNHFKSAVMALFTELVLTTPQFSGRAAANWNIGLGAPDFSVDLDWGDNPDTDNNSYATLAYQAHKAGDMEWAWQSLWRARDKVRLITKNTRVFISNSVQGDSDPQGGGSSPYYLADLQSPDYWYRKLRAANAGAERIEDVLMSEKWRGRMRIKNGDINQEFFT